MQDSPPDPDEPATAAELMAATGITEAELAAMPGGLELLLGLRPELSTLADELDGGPLA